MSSEKLTVAELLARNGRAGSGKNDRPRRRRSLEEGGVSVADITGVHPVVVEDDESEAEKPTPTAVVPVIEQTSPVLVEDSAVPMEELTPPKPVDVASDPVSVPDVSEPSPSLWVPPSSVQQESEEVDVSVEEIERESIEESEDKARVIAGPGAPQAPHISHKTRTVLSPSVASQDKPQISKITPPSPVVPGAATPVVPAAPVVPIAPEFEEELEGDYELDYEADYQNDPVDFFEDEAETQVQLSESRQSSLSLKDLELPPDIELPQDIDLPPRIDFPEDLSTPPVTDFSELPDIEELSQRAEESTRIEREDEDKKSSGGIPVAPPLPVASDKDDDYEEIEFFEDDSISWPGLIVQILVALVVGLGLFFGFSKLWASLPNGVVWIMALSVTFVIVGAVHALLRHRDRLLMILAFLVALILTVGPRVILGL